MKVQRLGITMGATVFIVGVAMLGVSAGKKPATVKGNISTQGNTSVKVNTTAQVEGATTPAPQPLNDVTLNVPDSCQKSVTTTPTDGADSGTQTDVSVNCSQSSSSSNSSTSNINVSNSSSQDVSSGRVSNGGTSGSVHSSNNTSINVKNTNR